MRPQAPSDPSQAAVRYRTQVVRGPEVRTEGLCHETEQGPALLPWEEVRLAVAAEVGEPEGVRTVVFDLVSRSPEGGWLAHRLDAEPGCEAMHRAREIAEHLTSEACGASLKSLATDGIPSRWYPDLPGLEEEALALLESREPRS